MVVVIVCGGGYIYIYIPPPPHSASRVNTLVGSGKRPPAQVTEGQATCAHRVNALVVTEVQDHMCK